MELLADVRAQFVMRVQQRWRYAMADDFHTHFAALAGDEFPECRRTVRVDDRYIQYVVDAFAERADDISKTACLRCQRLRYLDFW